MQILDMKALRLISIHKHLLTPPVRKFTSNPFHISSQYTSFSRQFHRRFGSQAPSVSVEASNGGNDADPDGKSPKVWTVFNPHGLVTQKVRNGGGGEEFEGETQKGLSDLEDGVEDSPEERGYESVKKSKSVGVTERVSFGEVVRHQKKKKKSKTCWVCSSCGYTDGQWWGMCRSCDAQGTMTEFYEGDAIASGAKVHGPGVLERTGTWLPKPENQVLPVRLKDVQCDVSDKDWRIPL